MTLTLFRCRILASLCELGTSCLMSMLKGLTRHQGPCFRRLLQLRPVACLRGPTNEVHVDHVGPRRPRGRRSNWPLGCCDPLSFSEWSRKADRRRREAAEVVRRRSPCGRRCLVWASRKMNSEICMTWRVCGGDLVGDCVDSFRPLKCQTRCSEGELRRCGYRLLHPQQ